MDVPHKVRAIIEEQLGTDEGEATPDSHIMDDLGADSLDVVELAMALEEEFEIQITDQEADAKPLVKDIIALVEQKLEAKSKK